MIGIYDINTCSNLNYKERLDIYKKCGFNDLHNFGRVFKQVVGIPPSKYRQPQDTDVFNYSGA